MAVHPNSDVDGDGAANIDCVDVWSRWAQFRGWPILGAFSPA